MTALFDNRLRPAFELLPAGILLACATVLAADGATLFPVMPGLAHVVAAAFLLAGLRRGLQGVRILRYRWRVSAQPPYVLGAASIPVSNDRLFLGRGFRWDQRHSQRMIETLDPSARRFLAPGGWRRWLSATSPPTGGNPCLHGVGFEDEQDVWMALSDRPAHTLVLGTTRVGKTRLAELLIAQDIRRGETVIVLDPKGDLELMCRAFAECRRAGRLGQFHLFHLGFPEASERYNPIGSFGRVTEVASRLSAQLPGEGDAAAFREFAWRFTNVIARALVALGRRPVFAEIARHLADLDPLLVDYHETWLARAGPPGWREAVQEIEQALDARAAPASAAGKARDSRRSRAVALTRFAQSAGLSDPIADALRQTCGYDRAWFEKIVAGLMPLLEKLTSGRAGALLTPAYGDVDDGRPMLDWLHVVRERGVVYVGLDALSDPEVAGAVGNAMFADLASLAGRLYKSGDAHGLPPLAEHTPSPICLHADEFGEIVGAEFIPLLNKGGGAGMQVTAYTQTLSDIEAGVGDRARAGQVAGNLGTLIMLRVRNEETAELLTTQLPKVRVYTKLIESRTTDDNDPDTPTDFTSANADRLAEVETELLRPADLVQLPRGEAFALLGGGQLHKLRLPLAAREADDVDTPESIRAWAKGRHAATGAAWSA